MLMALALGGCGKRALTLERGPPLWGAKAHAEYEAQKAAEKAEADRKAAEKKARDDGTAPPPSAPESTPHS
jgi:hypothetical protein